MPLLLSDRAVLDAPVPLITSSDAALAGIRPAEDRTLHRVRRGVYASRHRWSTLAPWERYATRVHALLRTRPDAVLCLESAAVVHGIPLFGETRDLHVYDMSATKTTRFGDVVVHASVDERTVTTIHGTLATTALDTAIDLARLLPPAQGLTVADAVISPAQGGALRLDDLAERASELQSRRGRTRARWVLARANGLAESPAESVSRAVIEWCGYEEPVQQPEFRYEGHLDRTDFGFRSNRALCEADGWGKYELDDPVRAAQHLQNEKRREDRLRRNGHPFGRWEPADAFRVDPLCRALGGAGLRPVFAPNHALLATLRAHPRALSRVAVTA